MEKAKLILEWLRSRLAEKSSWVAIASAVAFFGGVLPEAWIDSLQAFLPALISFVLFIMTDKKK